jgi:hypothetical protein
VVLCVTALDHLEWAGWQGPLAMENAVASKMPSGTHVYDRKAIDSALDRMSGFSPNVAEQSAYAGWKKSEGAA